MNNRSKRNFIKLMGMGVVTLSPFYIGKVYGDEFINSKDVFKDLLRCVLDEEHVGYFKKIGNTTSINKNICNKEDMISFFLNNQKEPISKIKIKIKDKINDDFNRGDVLVVDGWYMSKTEVQLSVLVDEFI